MGVIISEAISDHGYDTSAVKALTRRIENDCENVFGQARSDHQAIILQQNHCGRSGINKKPKNL